MFTRHYVVNILPEGAVVKLLADTERNYVIQLIGIKRLVSQHWRIIVSCIPLVIVYQELHTHQPHFAVFHGFIQQNLWLIRINGHTCYKVKPDRGMRPGGQSPVNGPSYFLSLSGKKTDIQVLIVFLSGEKTNILSIPKQ